jgi:anti-sigma regulatory factor (Ser/Thr protein kinase)
MMPMHAQGNAVFPLDDSSQVGAARRGVAALAKQAGLGEAAVARASIVATELASNLLGHARDGRLLARTLAEQPGCRGIELLAIDAGPGMQDIDRCLRDGYSTAGTPGTGLGAVRRQADQFDISSAPDSGTVVLARIREPAQKAATVRLGIVCLPYPGEQLCGDGWEWHADADGASLLVVDGLGHGPAAATAAQAAREAFAGDPTRTPEQALQVIHERLQGTRGGAAAIARIDLVRGTLHFAGIGNIGGVLLGRERRRGLPSHNGILGSVTGRIQGFEYDWVAGDMLVLHSDGLQSRWSLDHAPGAAGRDPAIVAGLLYRDFRRARDDLTVAVVA